MVMCFGQVTGGHVDDIGREAALFGPIWGYRASKCQALAKLFETLNKLWR